MVWLPTDKVDLANVALPVPSSVTAAPSEVAPSRNETVPVGTVVPDAGVTVDVNVTDCPEFDGFAEEVRAVEVFVFATTPCVSEVEELVVKFESPL